MTDKLTTTQEQKLPTKPSNFANLQMLFKKSEHAIALALPKHVTADRMIRIALTEARKNPKLLECDQLSFLGSIVQAAQLGLEPGSGLGQCWLVPYWNKKKNYHEVQFQIGYKGYIDLGYRSPLVGHPSARVVRKGDHFKYEYGTNEFIEHRVAEDGGDQREVTHYYAVVFLTNGTKIFEVMTKREMDEHREKYTNEKSDAWRDDYDEMAKKTVIRKAYKYAPVSIEIQRAVALDEASSAGLMQGTRFAIPDALPEPKTESEKLRDHLDGQTTELDPSELLPFEKEQETNA